MTERRNDSHPTRAGAGMGEGFSSRFKISDRARRTHSKLWGTKSLAGRVWKFVILLVSGLALSNFGGCSHAYTRRFVLAQGESIVSVGGWTIAAHSSDFLSYENIRGDTAKLGEWANYFFVSLTAFGTRTENNMLPHLDISIDTLRVELEGTDSIAVYPLYDVYILEDIEKHEVRKRFKFSDSSGSSGVIFIPGSVDTLRISCNARLTDRSKEQNTSIESVEIVMIRKESRTLAPWW